MCSVILVIPFIICKSLLRYHIFGNEVESFLLLWQPLGKLTNSTRAKRNGHSTKNGYFFQANDIDDAGKKRAVLLSVVGPVTYKLLKNLLAPAKPGEKTYDELVETLSAHYSPPPSEIIHRFKFHSCFRNPGESVATYVAELRSLAEFCNFGQTLEAMLRDSNVT